MKPRADVIRQRQLALLLRSDTLRRRLGEEAQVLQKPLAWVDRAQATWQWLWAHPEWPLAGAVALVVLRPQRALRWGTRLYGVWMAVQRVQHVLNRPARR